jgi:hypothetical protein
VRPTDVSETEPFELDTITLAYEIPIKLVAHEYVRARYKVTQTVELETFYRSLWGSLRSWSSSTTTTTTTTITVEELEEHFRLGHLILDYESTFR